MHLSAASGYQTSSFTVSGSGYLSGELLNVFMGPNSGSALGNFLATAQVATDGTFSVLVSIPAGTAPGQQDITIRDIAARPIQSLPFNVLPPAMSVSATSGTRGSGFTVSGIGYTTGEAFTVSLGGMELGSGHVPGAGNGMFSLPVNVPYMIPAGHQNLVVSSDHGLSKQFPFEVLAPSLALSLTPASGVPGAELKVNIAGYIPGETVQVLFGPTKDLLQQFTVGTDTATYVLANVPNGAVAGPNTVTVVGSRTTTPQSAQYTVVAPGNPAVTLSAPNGAAGRSFLIAGTGYTPGTTVTATLGAGGPRLGSTTVGSNGTFRINATVPAANAGTQNIIVTAPGTSGLSTPFTVLATTKPATPVTTGSSPTLRSVVVSADVPAQGPARGLKIQTAVQGTASAPTTGWVATAGLLGVLGLAVVVAVRRKRRA
ncbi:hypothetical protein [Specibacter sp. RAF43]|uniref:hypothetical protein n=1 Tax=Specibacter sp. RAF43 TaxID=3233057 RepID=UPI003F98CEB0